MMRESVSLLSRLHSVVASLADCRRSAAEAERKETLAQRNANIALSWISAHGIEEEARSIERQIEIEREEKEKLEKKKKNEEKKGKKKGKTGYEGDKSAEREGTTKTPAKKKRNEKEKEKETMITPEGVKVCYFIYS